MPRRNFLMLIAVCFVSLLCYQKVETNRYGRIVVDAMGEVERRYIEPVEPYDLFEGAMEGMVGQLEDQYSAFIGVGSLQEFHENLDQEFGGVGMEVSMDPKTKQLIVMSPLVGTPAYEAGILAGDKILRIDDRSTQGMSLKDAVGLMRGREGEPVVVSILHEGDDEPVEVTLIRARIQIDTVLGDTRNADGSWNFFLDERDRIGYLRISTFADKTVAEVCQALDWLLERKMRGLIVDLRDDPGGLLGAATDTCDLFIRSGVIVTTRGRDRQVRQKFEAGAPGTYPDFPMVVLVNQYSASASEIVAACLQDHERAAIIGQRTWGKGTVQEVINLEGGQGVLKLTTASYWRPSEKNIHRGKSAAEEDDWGVSPNQGCEVVVEGDELTRLRLHRLRRDNPKAEIRLDANGDASYVDPQLAKAVEYLEKHIRTGRAHLGEKN